ncbi:MAG: DUF3857 domain-containing protein [Deltaproteobacteria bacterium]|nr:DUF3857 domain-containing protein [Deltaproteobacteria bacterium]
MIARRAPSSAASTPSRPASAKASEAARRAGTLAVLVAVLVALVAAPSSAAPARGATAKADATPWASAAARAKGPGRWKRELERRRAILAGHRGTDPAAVLALTGALGELGGEIEPATLAGFVQGVAKDSKRHPLVRSFAGYLAARLAEQKGDLAAAGTQLRAQGYLLDWLIVGPFDNANRAGETTAYPPEQQAAKLAFDRDETMVGKLAGEPLSWRPWDYESLPRGGYVGFDDLLRPAEQAVGYATAWIHVDADTKAALHIGTAGPYAVWVDGTEVGRGDAYRAPDPLQDSHPITLRKGDNRVLVKVATLENMWGFFARVSTPEGAPLVGARVHVELPKAPHTSVAPSSSHTVASLRRALEQRADAAKRGNAALELVEFYRYTHPFDRDDKTASQRAAQVDATLGSARSALLLAILEPDPNGSRKALAAGVSRSRKREPALHGQLLLELAWRERSLGLEQRYDELLDEANAAAPDDPVIELALADRLRERGLPWAALRWTESLAGRHPSSQSMQLALASALRELGRTTDALAIYERIGREHGSERGTVAARIDGLLELGRADEAAKLADGGALAMPGLPEAHAEVARLQQANGNLEAARDALARAVALAPQDADLHARLGRLLARTGAREAAVASLERSLALKPQQPDVRDLLASLDTRAGKDLLARWGVSLEKVGAQPTPPAWKGQQAGFLHHRMAVKVLANGLTERLDHRIIRILDDRGVRSQAVQAYAYDPAESMVEVRRARVRRKDGTIEELGDVRTLQLAQSGYRMYYDQRLIQVGFPGLRVGDTLEVAFSRRDLAARNMFDEYFGDVQALSGTEPRKFVEYVLETPADKPIHFNVEVARATNRAGTVTTYRHALRDVPGIKPENGMPGWIEVAKFIHASTYATWDDVGRWYWGLVKEQLQVDDAIKGAVKGVLAKLPAGADEAAKVAAIYEHVVRNTRYVGLEFGIHGYKPYRTTDVYSRRFGDCKDKASLLKVMFAEAGIDSRLVLVRTRDQGNVPELPASLAVFNHAITYVPSLDLYLDGTAEWAGPRELPSGDQGATVLVVADGKGAKLGKIPFSKAADNVRDSKQRVKLDTEGDATLEQDLVVAGAAAAGVRYEFQSEGERIEKLQKAFGELYPGATVTGLSSRGMDDILVPPELHATMKVAGWAQAQGDGRRRFRVLGRASRLTQSFAPQDDRKYDLLIDTPSVEHHEISYSLPRGKRFSQLPAARKLEGPFGRFELAVDATDEGARVRTTIELSRARVGAKEYRAFREFLREVDAGLEQTFTVEDAR